MTVIEQRFMECVPSALREIAKQIEVANRLKAIELKGRLGLDLNVTPEMVDEALKG